MVLNHMVILQRWSHKLLITIGISILWLPCSLLAQIDNISLDIRLGRLEKLMSSQSVLDQADQIEQLQRDVQSMRGELEMLTHQIEQLKKQQQDIYLDLDKQLRSLKEASAAVSTPPTKTEPNTTSQSTDTTAVVTPPKQSTEADVDEPNDPNLSTTPSPAVTVTVTLPNNEEEAYQQVFKWLQEGNYDKSIIGFNQLLKTFPQGNYADNAQYWLGEAYFAQKNYAAAITALTTLLEKYPNSPKKASAMLKLGYAYDEQKDAANAKTTLEKVKSTFPGTASARLAEERLQKIRGNESK